MKKQMTPMQVRRIESVGYLSRLDSAQQDRVMARYAKEAMRFAGERIDGHWVHYAPVSQERRDAAWAATHPKNESQ